MGQGVGQLFKGLEMRGHCYVDIGRELSTKLRVLVDSFYGLDLMERLKLNVAKQMGFLGYAVSETEADSLSGMEMRCMPVFSGRRMRGYSSYDFVEDPNVFDALGLNVGNIWPPSSKFRREACVVYRRIAGLMRDISRGVLAEIVFESGRPFLKRGAFDGKCCSIMRLLQYPALPKMAISKAHTDYEFLSLIWPTVPGLEVMDSKGRWHRPPVRENSAILLPGDMLQLASQGVIESSMHRVRYGDEERRSVIFFQGLKFEEPLPKSAMLEARFFGHHLCGLLIQGTPHLASALDSGRLDLDFFVPEQNPFKKHVDR